MLFTHAVRIEQFKEKLDVQGLVSAAAAGKSAHLTARKLLCLERVALHRGCLASDAVFRGSGPATSCPRWGL